MNHNNLEAKFTKLTIFRRSYLIGSSFFPSSPQEFIELLLSSMYKSLTLKIQSSVLNFRNIMPHLESPSKSISPRGLHTSYKYSFELIFKWNFNDFIHLSNPKLNKTSPGQKESRFLF